MNWLNLLGSTLWIGSLSLALAAFGLAGWRAAGTNQSLRGVLNSAGPRFWLRLSGLMFSLGLAAAGPAGWARALWLIPAAWFVVRIVLAQAKTVSARRS